MKYYTVALILSGFILACPYKLMGQDTLFIQAVAHTDTEQIKIRWAPSNHWLWQYANEVGYTLERVTLKNQAGIALSPAERLASLKRWPAPFHPANMDSWKNRVDTSEVAGLAAAALFGEDMTVEDLSVHPMVQIYNRVQEQDNRFGFGLFAADQDWEVAKAMGLAAEDTDVQVGETYLYYVKPAKFPTSFVVASKALMAKAEKAPRLSAPTALKAQFGDRVVDLKWEANFMTNFSSYWIEKSLDGGQQFVPVNHLPIVPTQQKENGLSSAFYRDTLLENFQRVVYRIRAKSIFGEFSPPSDTLSGFGQPKRLAASIGISSIRETQAGQLEIQWDFPTKLSQHLEGFELYRASQKNGPFEKIHPDKLKAAERRFQDKSARSVNYYKIKAFDLYGHSYESFSALGQLLDEEPPLAPTGLQGMIDKEGKVSLSWQANEEDDHMGYRVFRSNQKEGFYNQVTSYFTRDTFYQHQVDMNTSSKSIYYKVIALDFRENYSEKSIFCEIQRPDLIPPIPPLMKRATPTDTGVSLQWVLSSSQDLAQHQLQRQQVGEPNWTTLLSIDREQSIRQFNDLTAKKQMAYRYRIMAIDEAGLEASSKVVEVSPLDKGIRAPIENFEVQRDSQAESIRISWKYPPAKKLHQFVLYRAEAGRPLGTHKQILAEALETENPDTFQASFKSFEFQDKRVKAATRYTYQLIAKYKDGGFSPLSPKISLQLP